MTHRTTCGRCGHLTDRATWDLRAHALLCPVCTSALTAWIADHPGQPTHTWETR